MTVNDASLGESGSKLSKVAATSLLMGVTRASSEAYMVVFISFCSLILGVIALLNANKNRALQTVLSALAIILSFIAVAFARPRSGSTLSIDYLGIIVSILGIMTTILLGYQLYNAFKIKEEADKVKALAKKNQEQSNYLRKRIKFMEKAIAELKDKEPDLKWTEYEE